MAGIPPTVGFTGKFVIFTAALEKGFYGLVVIAMVNAAISAFYYLKMARAVYCQGEEGEVETLQLGFGVKIFGVFLIIAIILVGIMPQGLMNLADQAVVRKTVIVVALGGDDQVLVHKDADDLGSPNDPLGDGDVLLRWRQNFAGVVVLCADLIYVD